MTGEAVVLPVWVTAAMLISFLPFRRQPRMMPLPR